MPDRHAVFSAFGRPLGNAPSLKDFDQAENKIQSLRVWDPPEFCLALFWYVYCGLLKSS